MVELGRPARGPALPLLVILCAASLGSCGLFTASAFSPDLTFRQTQYDLSGVIRADEADRYGLFTVDVGGSRFVILLGGSVHTPMIVFNGDLGFIQSFSSSEVSLAGPLVMADPQDPARIIVGNQLFRVDAGRLVPTGTPLDSPMSLPWSFGFTLSDVSGAYSVMNFSYNEASGVIVWAVWNSDWTPADTPEASITGAADGRKFSIERVFSDPVSRTATIVLREPAAMIDHYVTMDWELFRFYDYPAEGILGHEAFTRAPMPTDLLGYTRGAVPAYIGFLQDEGTDTRKGSFIRFDADVTTGSLHYDKRPDCRTAYPVSGDAYYVYDVDTRMITRFSAWWPQ